MHRIGLIFSDVLLMKAVKLMLEGMGYEPCLEAESGGFVITDTPSDVPESCRVLHIGRENKSGKLYLRRPFARDELDGAVRELVLEQPASRAAKGLRIDKKHSTVTLDGIKIPLTEKELELLLLLYERIGTTVSDAEIIKRVWKNETVSGSNIASVYVNYLRKKLDERVGRRLIFRVRGEGYALKLNKED